jgi:hypothetical protein
MRTQPHVDDEPRTFRAATLDEAIELAEQSLGPQARIVAANHIRRGGIGGFFASDQGVEVTAVVDDDLFEAPAGSPGDAVGGFTGDAAGDFAGETLERIVQEAAMQERDTWLGRSQVGPSAADEPFTALGHGASFADVLQATDAQVAPGRHPSLLAPAPAPARSSAPRQCTASGPGRGPRSRAARRFRTRGRSAG